VDKANASIKSVNAGLSSMEQTAARTSRGVSVGIDGMTASMVKGATTVHLLKMPSAKDVFDYRRRFARVLDLPCNRQELTINLAVAGALYKRLITATEGYAGEVPIIHQAVAVKAAIDALDAAFQETADPN
jgi:hypothetical protein